MLIQLSGPDAHMPSPPNLDGSTVGRLRSESSGFQNDAKGRIRASLRRRARATFIVMPNIHVFSEDLPSNLSRLRRHVSQASWTTSSAPPISRSEVVASLIIGPWWRWMSARKAASSPARSASRSASFRLSPTPAKDSEGINRGATELRARRSQLLNTHRVCYQPFSLPRYVTTMPKGVAVVGSPNGD